MTADERREVARENARRIAAEFAASGDATGWFDAFYREAAGDPDAIPWADLEPNSFLTAWADKYGLEGNGRTALVVGCGLGDDVAFLADRGFKATGFDISPTAVEWARKLYSDKDVRFEVVDLFQPPGEWLFENTGGFDFVLEVYTIQPLPMEMRERVIDAIASFVRAGGELLVITRGREDDEEPTELPWALSRRDLARFTAVGLTEQRFDIMMGDEDPPIPRFAVSYRRPAAG